MKQGIVNSNYQKNANLSLVAGTVWRNPSVSRIGMANALSMHRSTVSNLVGLLIKNGIVVEGAAGDSTRLGGRRPVTLSIDEDFGLALGLEIREARWAARFVTLGGRTTRIIEGASVPGDFPATLDRALAEADKAAKALGKPVLGACVGIPGIVNTARGVVVKSDPLGVRDFDFDRHVSENWRIPVAVENDANCCAWGDLMTKRAEGISDFVSVLVELRAGRERAGIGVGMGIVIGGKVHHGASFAAGELISMGRISGADDRAGTLPRPLSKAPSGSAERRRFARDLFDRLVPVVTALDPQAVYAHGDLAAFGEAREAAFEEGTAFREVMASGKRTFEIVDDAHSVSFGAAASLLDRLFSVPVPGVSAPADWEAVFSAAGRSADPWRIARGRRR